MHGVHRKEIMVIKNYEVVNCKALNVRKEASIESSILGVVKAGEIIQVVQPNAVIEPTRKWHKIKYKNKYGYVSASYTKVKDYLSLVAKNADKVFNKIVEIGCIHKYSSKTYAQMLKNKTATCATSTSIALQFAGVLSSGEVVSHTEKVGDESNVLQKKNTISKAILHSSYLNEGTCSIVKIGKTYSKMKSKYKKKGIVYVYNSSIGINAGENSIYCLADASYQKKNGKYVKVKLKGSYYPFTHKILYAIVPNS